MLHTAGGAQASNPLVRAIGIFVQSGWIGVSLFFVLSGFLISGILWDTHGRPGWMKNFYMRRTLRIFPLYYASLLLVLLTAFMAGTAALCLSHIWVFLFYLQNIPHFGVYTSNYGSPLWLSHFWSLAVEEQFYLLWPFLISRMRDLRDAKCLCLGVFIVSFCFRFVVWTQLADPIAFNGFLLTRAGELALGAFLAMCYRDSSWRYLDRFAPLATLLGLAGFLAVVAINRSFVLHNPIVFIYGIPCLSFFWGGVLVLALRPRGAVRRAMSFAWLRWVGNISYGIYIYHVLLTPCFHRITEHIWPTADRVQSLVLGAVVTIVVSFSLAWLSFRFFETPFLNLRKRFSRSHRTAETVSTH
jgi:peptidoglycan/LPS O-acetylase OafA/YrhL